MVTRKPHWEMTYGEIWAEFRDNPHYAHVSEADKRRIHIKWKELTAEVSLGGVR